MARPDDALALLWAAMARVPLTLGTVMLPIAQARGCVLATEIRSPGPIPEFRRSTVDGFARPAADTGAGQILPVAGEIPMGVFRTQALPFGATIKIHTGRACPEGADAVIMVERTTELPNGQIRLDEALSPGDNVIQIAEDVQPGECGHFCRRSCASRRSPAWPRLASPEAPVRRRPRVALISVEMSWSLWIARPTRAKSADQTPPCWRHS